jgi:hypothetical protein
MRTIYNLFIALFLISPLSAQFSRPVVPWEHGLSDAQDLKIMLVTISPGDYLTDWWGHVGIAVEDSKYKVTRVYNFGLFSFEDGFISRFAMGRLIFWAGDASLQATINRYMEFNRTIAWQELNIKDEKKLELAQKLSFFILPENSHYLYHHYYDNCATRLRDFIDEAVDGNFKEFTQKTARLTFRQHTLRYTAHAPLMQWLLMFLMNDSIDKEIMQWDEMFLPDELAKYAGQLLLNDSVGTKPFILNAGLYYKAERETVPDMSTNWPLWTIFCGLLLGLGAVGAIRINLKLLNTYTVIVSFTTGFIGLALFLMSLFTDHTVTHGNENIFLANPLSFLIFLISIAAVINPSAGKYRIIEKSWFALALMSIVLLLLKIFPMFDQDNLMIISVLLPVNLGFAYAWYKSLKVMDKSKSI